MMKIKDFTQLEVYQLANKLTFKIKAQTQNFPKNEDWRITDQLLRACYSIGANIAEGFGRFHRKEFIKFLYISRGSLAEVQHFLILSQKFSYLKKKEYQELEKEIKNLGVKLNNLIKSLIKFL